MGAPRHARTCCDSCATNRSPSLRRIKAVSDAYGLDTVDTTFRVRNDLMSWEEGVQVSTTRAMRIDAHWRALEAAPQDPQQRALFGRSRRHAPTPTPPPRGCARSW